MEFIKSLVVEEVLSISVRKKDLICFGRRKNGSYEKFRMRVLIVDDDPERLLKKREMEGESTQDNDPGQISLSVSMHFFLGKIAERALRPSGVIALWQFLIRTSTIKEWASKREK